MPNVETGKYWDASWNPITGCTPEFDCWQRCWARAMSKRFPAMTGGDFEPRFHPDRLEKLPGGKGKVVAVNWLGDMLAFPGWHGPMHVLAKMINNPQHHWLLLTKRVRSLIDLDTCYRMLCDVPVPPHVWFGISASSQSDLRMRLNPLLYFNASSRWLSLEPLLEPVSLNDAMDDWWESANAPKWVVVGSEQGPGARKCDPDWIRRIRDECVAVGVPLWVKQINGVSRLADLPEDLRLRETPK